MPEHVFSWLFFYIFLGILITLGVVLFFPKRGLLIPALTPNPERFTELYFEDHLTLPKKVMALQPITISFTIHNLEGKSMNYPISVTAEDSLDPPTIVPLYQDSVVVSDGQTKTVPVTFQLPENFSVFEKAKITVLLKNLNQHIDFFSEVALAASSSATASASPSVSKKSPAPQFQFLFEPASSSAVPATRSSLNSGSLSPAQ